MEMATPTTKELQNSLAGLIAQDVGHQEHQRKASSSAGQSFYQQFSKEKEEKQMDQRHSKSAGGKASGGKGLGKSKPGLKGKGPSAPKFDLSKICPQKNLVAWQRLESLLEKGETANDSSLNNAVCVLDSYFRMLEFQSMAEAHGLTLKTLLICRIDSEQFDKDDGGKCEMLPFMGNLALMRARITCLDRSEPSFKGVTPLPSSAPGLSEEEQVSLRIIAPLSLIEDKKTFDYLLKHPEYTLRLLKCPLKEVKTNSWSGSKGLIIPASQVEVVLRLSGTGGIFVQRLRKDILQLPEVNWLPQEPSESDVAYFKRASAAAVEKSLPLSYRSGGGAWLGIQDPSASSNAKCWAVNGIPDLWGPRSVVEWMKSVGWTLEGHPSPPRSGRQVWQVHARPPVDDIREQYGYELKVGNGDVRNLLIKRWQKHRAVPQGARITGPKWWSADFNEPDPIELFDTQPIAPTVLEDTQMTVDGSQIGENAKSKHDNSSGDSPEKKKAKIWKEPQATAPSWRVAGGQKGPGAHTALLDLGGDGDCGWRVVSYMVAMQNSRWKEDTDKVVSKVDSLALSLHAKTTTFLLSKDLSWQKAWTPDPASTERTESGAVAKSLSEFKLSLKRPKRWLCGLTLAGIALQQKISIVVFGVVDSVPTFQRLAVFSGTGDLDRMPIIPIVLVAGHYFAVNKVSQKANFPTSWVKEEGIVQVGSLLDIDHSKIPFIRGGGDDVFSTPAKKINAAMEDHLLRTCQSTGRGGGSTQDSLLKTCSSRRSGLMSVKKTIGKGKQNRSSSSKAPSFTDPAQVAAALKENKRVTWTCGFCNWRIGVTKGDSMKVVKHIRTRHRAEYDLKIQQFLKLGRGKKRGVSGFGIRGIKIPVEFRSLSRDEWQQARFVCPYCNKGHPGDLTRHEWLLAKSHHLKNCDSKPKKKVSPLQFFHDYTRSNHCALRRSKWFSGRGQVYTDRAHRLALQRGHDAVFFPVIGFSGCKVNIHMCRLCKARTGSSGWTQPCKKRSIRIFCSPSPAWWKRIARANDWKPVAQILQLSEKEQAEIGQMLEE